MKLVKSLLLGSAAGLCAVAGAQAADLPVRKAAPVEYVRVCTAYGAGFFYIPGTDTCLRVGGRARFEYQYTSTQARNINTSGYRAVGRLQMDARTQTDYGTLRAFVRLEVMSRTGAYFFSGTQARNANGYTGIGQDSFGQVQKSIDIDKAFIQFAGITAGRSASFYDFYAHDVEMIGSSVGSDVSSTNLFAYTQTFGNGFSATVSMEDPSFRRNPVFASTVNGGIAGGTFSVTNFGQGNYIIGGTPLDFIGNAYNAAGVPTSVIGLDVTQRNYMPDFVGALRYDAAWGSAQVSGAVHEIRTGLYQSGTTTGVNGGVASGNIRNIPGAEYGWAVQGGLKLNVPQLAPGDVLWLQASYGEGALAYTGISSGWGGYDTLTTGTSNRFAVTQTDLVYDAYGRAHLTESYAGTIAFLHYWAPQWRQGLFASHGQVIYDSILRTSAGPLSGGIGSVTGGVVNQFNPVLKSWGVTYVGTNLIWSPVRDLDIGVEVVYQRVDPRGRVVDINKGGVVGISGSTVAGTGRTTTTDDQVLARFRVQRDF